MKYPEDFINKIIQGDCLEVMKDIPDKSVDLVLTDPPYNMNYSGRGLINKFGNFENDNLSEEEHSVWIKDILLQIERVLKADSSLYVWIDFRNYARFYNIINELFNIKNCIVWDKKSIGMGQCYRFQHEFCIYAQKGHVKLNTDKNFPDVWSLYREKDKYKHPTQKPVSLMYRCIKHSSKDGDVILDPFIGSGTTAVACKQLKRNFIGIEISPEYCKIAEQRLRQDLLI